LKCNQNFVNEKDGDQNVVYNSNEIVCNTNDYDKDNSIDLIDNNDTDNYDDDFEMDSLSDEALFQSQSHHSSTPEANDDNNNILNDDISTTSSIGKMKTWDIEFDISIKGSINSNAECLGAFVLYTMEFEKNISLQQIIQV
jgi:hypothetical protein